MLYLGESYKLKNIDGFNNNHTFKLIAKKGYGYICEDNETKETYFFLDKFFVDPEKPYNGEEFKISIIKEESCK